MSNLDEDPCLHAQGAQVWIRLGGDRVERRLEQRDEGEAEHASFDGTTRIARCQLTRVLPPAASGRDEPNPEPPNRELRTREPRTANCELRTANCELRRLS